MGHVVQQGDPCGRQQQYWIPVPRADYMSLYNSRSKNTQPELLVHQALRSAGQAFDCDAKTPVGRADLVLTRGEIKLAVFIDGCFWHGCPDHYVPPRSRIDFWAAKLAGNVARDQRQTATLEETGWRVIRVWEHEALLLPDGVARRILLALEDRTPRRNADWRVVEVRWLDADKNLESRQLQSLRNSHRTRCEERPRQTYKVRAVTRTLDASD